MSRVDCRLVDESFVDYLYQELDAGAMGEMRAHVEVCHRCSTEDRRFRGVRRQLARLERLEPPALVSARLLQTAARARSSRARRASLYAAPMVAMAAALVLWIHVRGARVAAPPPAARAPVAGQATPAADVPPVAVGQPRDESDARALAAPRPAGPPSSPPGRPDRDRPEAKHRPSRAGGGYATGSRSGALYRELLAGRDDDCARVMDLVKRLESARFGARHPGKMRNAYELRASCQADELLATQDQENARRMDLAAEKNDKRARGKRAPAGSAKAARTAEDTPAEAATPAEK